MGRGDEEVVFASHMSQNGDILTPSGTQWEWGGTFGQPRDCKQHAWHMMGPIFRIDETSTNHQKMHKTGIVIENYIQKYKNLVNTLISKITQNAKIENLSMGTLEILHQSIWN